MKFISRGSPDLLRHLRRDQITSDFSFEPLANFDTCSHYWAICLVSDEIVHSLVSNRPQKDMKEGTIYESKGVMSMMNDP